jgi:hypothetical protein
MLKNRLPLALGTLLLLIATFPAQPAAAQCCDGQPVDCPIGYFDLNLCRCVPHDSPIIIDVSGRGFQLTDAQGGVSFDLNGDIYIVQGPFQQSGQCPHIPYGQSPYRFPLMLSYHTE